MDLDVLDHAAHGRADHRAIEDVARLLQALTGFVELVANFAQLGAGALDELLVDLQDLQLGFGNGLVDLGGFGNDAAEIAFDLDARTRELRDLVGGNHAALLATRQAADFFDHGASLFGEGLALGVQPADLVLELVDARAQDIDLALLGGEAIAEGVVLQAEIKRLFAFVVGHRQVGRKLDLLEIGAFGL